MITTVGYGDYTGSTTIEYAFSLAIEFIGFIIFAVLQIQMLDLLDSEYSLEEYANELDFEALGWLNLVEAAGQAPQLEHALYSKIRQI